MDYITVADSLRLYVAYLHARRGLAAKFDRSVAEKSEKYALREFKVIQGHRIWHQSNGHIHVRLPIIGPVVSNCIFRTVSE